MPDLMLALFVEGSTDRDFLPIIIQRTAQHLLYESERSTLDVASVEVVDEGQYRNGHKERSECILQAAREKSHYHALIVHSDNDGRTVERTLKERYVPGYTLVQNMKKQSKELVCEHMLPIVPVQMIEAWMLADSEVLHKEIGTKTTLAELKLPKTKQVEKIADPKQKLKEIVNQINAGLTRRRRLLDSRDLYEPLARQIRLERLREVPSYQQFVRDLTATMQKLNFID